MTTEVDRSPARRSVVIQNVPWATYETILTAFDERNNVRFAYDRGALEVMAPLELGSQSDCEFLSDIARESAGRFGCPLRHGGSVTLRRADRGVGIDPDKCFWLANAPRLAGVKRIDLTIHPPPDLAIEVDVTNDSLDKLAIYAGLGVPELWRLDGDELRFLRLGSDHAYADTPASVAFPRVTPSDLMRFVADSRTAPDQLAVVRAFRAWAAGRAT